MRRLIAALFALALLLGGLCAIEDSPATGQTTPGSEPCVTRTRWAQVDIGQTLAKVKSELGSGGYQYSNTTLRSDRLWGGCSPYDNAYTHLELDFKRADTSSAWHVVYESSTWTHD